MTQKELISMGVWQGECLLWHGATEHGYGMIRTDGQRRAVHRLMYELMTGHRAVHIQRWCGNRLCYAPKHLKLAKQNPFPSIQQLLDRGRWEGECYIWIRKQQHPFGYGQMKVNGVVYTAPRLMYILHYGDPGEKYVLHHCDNPKCYRIEHLYAGTQKHNVHDALNRGRWPKGDTHHNSKLSDEQILEIYHKVSSKALPEVPFGLFAQMGREYGVSARQISYIREKKRRQDLLKDL